MSYLYVIADLVLKFIFLGDNNSEKMILTYRLSLQAAFPSRLIQAPTPPWKILKICYPTPFYAWPWSGTAKMANLRRCVCVESRQKKSAPPPSRISTRGTVGPESKNMEIAAWVRNFIKLF